MVDMGYNGGSHSEGFNYCFGKGLKLRGRLGFDAGDKTLGACRDGSQSR